jgi:hypothetical protein
LLSFFVSVYGMMQKPDIPNSSDAVAADIESGVHHLALDNQGQGHPPIYCSDDLEDFGVYLRTYPKIQSLAKHSL